MFKLTQKLLDRCASHTCITLTTFITVLLVRLAHLLVSLVLLALLTKHQGCKPRPAPPRPRKIFNSAPPIRKASLFSRGRKRDSEEIILLKMADLGGGQHPVRAVRSKQLTRRAFWADPTIHLLGQVVVESREGIEELTIDQARILGRPDRRRPRGKC